MLLMAGISQRTERVKLGTACLVTATRNPLYLALEWATLDHMSGGRTILGDYIRSIRSDDDRHRAA